MSGRSVLAALLVIPLVGCEWFTDFKRQPSIWTWESIRADSNIVRGNPQFSVPITGNPVPGYAVSYAPLPATVDSMSGLANPTPPNPASLLNGRKYYAINCAVCHGATGQGNGPAAPYGMAQISLVNDRVRGLSDGYLFGMIRNGRGLMPTYNRIEELDRWDVVNYIRGLQGRLGTPVDTGAVGLPGQTGATLPGATKQGPTRPVPHLATPAGAARDTVPRDTTARPAGDTTRTGVTQRTRP